MRQEATLDQAAKILSVFRNTPVEQVQAIVGSGLLADLRDGNVAEVNREEFRKMLGLKASESVPPKWEVWKTLTVGGIAKEELLRRLDAEGFRVSDWARDIMGKPGFVTSAKSVDVPFARCRVSDPGFTEKPTTVRIPTMKMAFTSALMTLPRIANTPSTMMTSCINAMIAATAIIQEGHRWENRVLGDG